MSNTTIIKSGFKVLWFILLGIGTIIGFNYAFAWMDQASTVKNIAGLVGILVILILDLLILKRITRNTQK